MDNKEFKTKMVEVQETYTKKMMEAKTDEERFKVMLQQNKHTEMLLMALDVNKQDSITRLYTSALNESKRLIKYVITNVVNTGSVTGIKLTENELEEVVEELQIKRDIKIQIIENDEDEGNIFDIYSI